MRSSTIFYPNKVGVPRVARLSSCNAPATIVEPLPLRNLLSEAKASSAIAADLAISGTGGGGGGGGGGIVSRVGRKLDI